MTPLKGQAFKPAGFQASPGHVQAQGHLFRAPHAQLEAFIGTIPSPGKGRAQLLQYLTNALCCPKIASSSGSLKPVDIYF